MCKFETTLNYAGETKKDFFPLPLNIATYKDFEVSDYCKVFSIIIENYTKLALVETIIFCKVRFK